MTTEYSDNNGTTFKADEILPCPFCGTDAEIKFIGNSFTTSRKVTIQCRKCNVKMTNATIRHNHEWIAVITIDKWNKRANNQPTERTIPMKRIICSAIYFPDFVSDKVATYIGQGLPKNLDKGLVFAGRRHHNCIATYYALTGKTVTGEIQGFITSDDEFVNRVTALEIARKANQILNEDEIRGNQLFSEDIY